MKKILTLLLLLLLCGCANTKQEEEIVEPETFEPTTTSTKQTAYYVMPIADKDGNMVIPLSADCAIITTDETKAKFMCKTFEETIVYYHILLDPTHDFEGINNVKTINDNYGLGPVEVNGELIDLLDNAITMSELTNGYFNPTIGTVSDVWKDLFNNEHVNNDPDETLVKEKLVATIPYDKLRDYIILDKVNNTVTFKALEDTDLKVKIDLGAYSKGYVMDKVYEKLLKYKDGFLISAGGSSIITHVEDSQEKLHWIIGIKNPNNGASALQIRVENLAISTSGDEQQFFINENGIRRHHILNPYTGYPENHYRSVTLVSETNAGALDALSTAVYSADDVDEVICNVKDNYNIDIAKALITEDENKKLLLEYGDNFANHIYEIDPSQVKDITK